MCNDYYYYPTYEENTIKCDVTYHESIIPAQPNIVKKTRIELCSQCKALRNIAPNYSNTKCHYCSRPTYDIGKELKHKYDKVKKDG
jgi:hypothetical protein